jgi:hypothetical protein
MYMELLVKHTEYTVDFGRRLLQVTVPAQWLRDYAKQGDKLGLFEDPRTHRLIIDVLPQDKQKQGE